MAKVFKTEFYFGIFRVYVGDDTVEDLGQQIIEQPFIPDGSNIPWPDEETALAWWETRKDNYQFHIQEVIGELPPPNELEEGNG